MRLHDSHTDFKCFVVFIEIFHIFQIQLYIHQGRIKTELRRISLVYLRFGVTKTLIASKTFHRSPALNNILTDIAGVI